MVNFLLGAIVPEGSQTKEHAKSFFVKSKDHNASKVTTKDPPLRIPWWIP